MAIPQKNSYSYFIFLLLIAIVCIQVSGSLAKILFQSHDVLVVATMRLLLGTIMLSLISRLWTIKLNQVHWKTVISYGLALGGMNGLFYLSLERLPLGIAVSFEFIGPLSVALFHAKQKFDFIWVGLAIFGMCLLFPFNQAHQSLDPIGVFYALSAGACWAMYILSGQKKSEISSNHAVSLGMLIGTILLLPFAISTGTLSSVLNGNTIGYFLLLALLASALPYALEMVVLKKIPPLVFSTLTSLEPAFAALSGFIFLHEKLLLTQWLALSTIIIASVGCIYSTHRAKLRIEQRIKNQQKKLEEIAMPTKENTLD